MDTKRGAMKAMAMRKVGVFLFLLVVFGASEVYGADLWAKTGDPMVTAVNDCGQVSRIRGRARIKRSYMAEKDAPDSLVTFDRVHAGDEIETGPDGAAEVVTGNNVLVLIGPGTKVVLRGVRLVDDGTGKQTACLDLGLLQGVVRTQVRLHQNNPEAVLVESDAVSALSTRGDMAVSTVSDWLLAVLAGSADYRTTRGGRNSVLETGLLGKDDAFSELDGALADSIASRLPFTYEIVRAALPPLPPPDPYAEAP